MGINSQGKPKVSLVMPAYNEGDHIVEILERTNRVMSEVGVDYEVILVNDGSEDTTGLKAFEYARINSHFKVISYSGNRGKGYAIKTGFLSATGDFVVFIDSDLEIEPNQIWKYIKALENGDIAIGSKKHPESKVEAPFLRRFLSWGFYSLVKVLTGIKLSDTQTGLKAVRKKRLEKIFSVLSVKRFAFDVELLVAASCCGLSIVEMPVIMKLKKRFFRPKEILRMLIDLLGITYRLRIRKQYHNRSLRRSTHR